ncbi:MAG TPA: ferredoxin [Acidimicrobiales bacterium]|nr:ferredoxin [Acidimicrobiales bacterium]
MNVWIDADLCTGDGICAEIAPAVFFMEDDGLAYVKESKEHFSDVSADKKFNEALGQGGTANGVARIPDALLEDVIEAAEECPGECIFIEP